MKIVKTVLLAFVILLLSADIRNALVNSIIGVTIENVGEASFLQLLLLILLFSGLFIIISIIGYKVKLLDWKNSLFSKQNTNYLLITLALALAQYLILTFVFGYPQERIGIEKIEFWLNIGSMLLVAPLAEELVFRGLLTKVIFPSRLALSLAITSILFILVHYPNGILEWFDYGLSAALLSFLYYKTGRVELAVLLHIFMNLLVIALG